MHQRTELANALYVIPKGMYQLKRIDEILNNPIATCQI
ncbi:hypothetical protein SAMCCGM7_pC0597 (plasmid) [Sinorhizobium americanum CCGM7]|nr:hypothetical protein SAMCCGM7_pC0597 [Sinorhizobium americanum CCGM7]